MVPPADLDKWALNQGFPDLVNVAAKQTSQFDEYYNCIAHAFLDDQNWWWPTGLPAGGHDQHGCYWPMASDNRTCMQAFTDWFAKDGWTQSSSDSFDPNKQKIALYADFNNRPTHAARQLGHRIWTSKLGKGLDLSHDLRELTGPTYGRVITFFEKAASMNPTPSA